VKEIKSRVDRQHHPRGRLEPMRLARKLASQVCLDDGSQSRKAPRPGHIFTLLRPGDILTHCASRDSTTAFWNRTALKDFVRRAWTEGWSWMSATGREFQLRGCERMLAAGCPPTSSTPTRTS